MAFPACSQVSFRDKSGLAIFAIAAEVACTGSFCPRFASPWCSGRQYQPVGHRPAGIPLADGRGTRYQSRPPRRRVGVRRRGLRDADGTDGFPDQLPGRFHRRRRSLPYPGGPIDAAANAAGRGTVVVGGRLIEKHQVEAAKRLLNLSEMIEKLEAESA